MAYSISLAPVSARETIADFIRHSFSMRRILLPFLLLFVFCPEPAQSVPDDFLPSVTPRFANIKAVRSISPVRGEKSDALKFALAIGGVPFTAVFRRFFVLVDPSHNPVQRYFAGLRPVRAPPRQAHSFAFSDSSKQLIRRSTCV